MQVLASGCLGLWELSKEKMNIEWKGSAYRIKKCATDLLSVGDLIEDDEEDSWDLMGRDIRLKSTFLYCDFNQVISNAPQELKKPLLELANKLFHYIEEVNLLSYLIFVFNYCFIVFLGIYWSIETQIIWGILMIDWLDGTPSLWAPLVIKNRKHY